MNRLVQIPLSELPGLDLHPNSRVVLAEVELMLAWANGERCLVVTAPPGDPALDAFHGRREEHEGRVLLLAPTDHANATALRSTLPWLQPRPLGLATSAGLGDRLGLATPGHARAARRVAATAGARPLALIFAQQSAREMARTGRTPEMVLDDATWGAFQEGWPAAIGADADHLKSFEDVDRGAATGFSLFTIDPGDQVDPSVDALDESGLRARYAAVPWQALDSSPDDLRSRCAGRRFDLDDRRIVLSEESLVRAAVKYGGAVAQVAGVYRRLAALRPAEAFEIEVSVDETPAPTSHAEHLYVAVELARLGVHWVSLAPRFVGRFEKGVDYIGDLRDFERDFAGHAAVARCVGPYKLSLHSGSDKFSIYGIAAEHARGLLHLKTAGTSYVEALRVVAIAAPDLFRRIYDVALRTYETDRASYHVSADLRRVPPPAGLTDGELPACLDRFDVRQVMHVTFGSVLSESRGLRQPLLETLQRHSEEYAAILENHLARHLAPLAAG